MTVTIEFSVPDHNKTMTIADIINTSQGAIDEYFGTGKDQVQVKVESK